MNILVVEDNTLMAQMIVGALTRKGFAALNVPDGTAALAEMETGAYDAILLDLRLEDCFGIDLLHHARQSGITTPVMILSGDMEPEVKVAALTAGADDYLTKPFKVDEMIARIRAIVRRAAGAVQPELRIGRLALRLNDRSGSVDAEPLTLTRKEFDLLEALATQKGRTLTKEGILAKLYGGRDEPDAKIIDVFVCKLRKKLAEAMDGESLVRTVWGQGYVIEEPAALPRLGRVG